LTEHNPEGEEKLEKSPKEFAKVERKGRANSGGKGFEIKE